MPSSKRFHGWTKRRFLPFGSVFCEITLEVANNCKGDWQLIIFRQRFVKLKDETIHEDSSTSLTRLSRKKHLPKRYRGVR